MANACMDAETLSGLPAIDAVWRLLSIGGADLPLVEFHERWRGSDNIEALLPALEIHGVPGRVVRIRPAGLPALTLPALLLVQQGGWVVVRARSGRRWIVEGETGATVVTTDVLASALSGLALEPVPDLPGGATLRERFRNLLWRQRHVVLQVVFASLLLQALALLTPELSALALGRALPDGAGRLLQLVAVCAVLVALFSGAIGWFRERATLYLLTHLEAAVKRGFLDHVLRLPFPLLQRHSLGDLLQAFSGITVARTLFAERALGALFDGVLALGYLLLMGFKLWAPTLIMLVAVLFVAMAIVVVGRAQARVQAEEVRAQARQRGYLTELIGGICAIKAAGAERPCHSRWVDAFQAELRQTLRRQRLGLLPQVGLDALRQAFSATLLLWGGYSVLQGTLGIGPMFGLLLLGEGFLRAAVAAADAYLTLAVVKVQLERTEQLFSAPALPKHAPDFEVVSVGSIVMSDVWFRYDTDGPWILEGYDLRIEAGEKVMLDGPSGFGKSTILRLLAGLYRPERGTITIAGRDLSSIQQRALYLPQFVQLYAGSIEDNLRILSGGASRSRVRAAAQSTGFDAVVEAMPMKYESLLQRGGGTLSGGQRQLLALTAALASERNVLFLDEPLANIDALAQHELARMLRADARTIVIAGHGHEIMTGTVHRVHDEAADRTHDALVALT